MVHAPKTWFAEINSGLTNAYVHLARWAMLNQDAHHPINVSPMPSVPTIWHAFWIL